MTKTRVLPGVPTGGEFTARVHTADTITLPAGPGPVPEATATTPLTGKQAIDVSLMHVRAFSKHRSGFNTQDYEDMAQEALMSVHVSILNARADAFTPGLITSAARHMHARAINTSKGIRHEDAKAEADLRSIVDIDEQTLGRQLTDAEIDFMATQIRNEWDNPRHKPSEGFHKRAQQVSLRGCARAEALTIASAAEVSQKNGVAEALASDIETKAIDRATAKQRFWNAISGDWDVPQTRENMSVRDIRTAKSVVGFHGGILNVSEAYLRSGALTPQASAMFAPFGAISKLERERIASVLLARPGLAERIWDCALASAYKAPARKLPAWAEDE